MGLHIGDKLLEVFGGEILLRNKRHRRLGDNANRLEVLDRVIAQMGIESRVGGVTKMHHQEVVAIGHSSRNLRGSDRATGTGRVLDKKLSSKNLVDSLRRDAGDHITRTARSVWHHHYHRPGAGIVLCQRRSDEETSHEEHRIENFKHMFLSCARMSAIALMATVWGI